MRKIVIVTLIIFSLQGCQSYLIDKDSAARQMTGLKIEKKSGHAFELSTGKDYGRTYYATTLDYLIVKNDSRHSDTIYPIDIKFYLKSGINDGWSGTHKLIFKEGYFITFTDTTLKTNPKCSFCKIHIDSIEKIVIRGPRLNKKK